MPRNVIGTNRLIGNAIRTVIDGAPIGDFEAPLVKDLNLRFGQGVATFTRASTASVTDFEGIIRQAKSGEARFEGARRVSNLVSTKSEDWTHASWIKTIGTVTATTLTSTGANQTVLQTYTGTGDFRLRVEMSRITGTGNIDLTVNGGGTWTTVTLTGSTQAFSILGIGITNPQFGIRIVTSGDAINAAKIQLEDVTGQANKNPSEYVSVGVLTSAPYHGANVDGVKYVITYNGNTVASNVVTEATGAAIPDATLKGYLAEGQRTNLLLQSEDFGTTWGTSNLTVATNNVTAPSGAVTADTVTATGVSTVYPYQNPNAAAGTNTFSVHVKQGISFVLLAYGSTGGISAIFDSSSMTYLGSVSNGTGMTLNSTNVTNIGDGWYRISMTYTSSIITTGVGIVLDKNKIMTWGFANATSIGDTLILWGAQLEQASFASSYIPTTTASVTRNADSLTYPTAGNFSNTAGSTYAEWLPMGVQDYAGVLGFGSNRILGYSSTAVGSYDGTTSINTTINPTNINIKNGAVWSAGITKIYANATSNSGSYDGSWGLTNLTIGITNVSKPFSGNIRNVKVWKKALTDAQLIGLTS